MTDESRTELLRGGLLDAGAFRAFYEETLPSVYGYFLRRCGSSIVAEDLTQETYATALRTLEGGTSPDNAAAWIVLVARRRLVDHWRRETAHRRRVEAMRVRPSAVVRAPDDPPDETIVRALRCLSAIHRTVLVLRYVDDLKVGDVASLIRRSERATESLLVRARAALAEAYAEVADD